MSSPKAVHIGFTPPYRGDNYRKSPLKLLIVGESHYDWAARSCEAADATKQAVGNSRFHSEISRLLNGGDHFWKGVAFCNMCRNSSATGLGNG